MVVLRIKKETDELLEKMAPYYFNAYSNQLPREGIINTESFYNKTNLKDEEFVWLLYLIRNIKQRKYFNKHPRVLKKRFNCERVCETCGKKLKKAQAKKMRGYVVCESCFASLKKEGKHDKNSKSMQARFTDTGNTDGRWCDS